MGPSLTHVLRDPPHTRGGAGTWVTLRAGERVSLGFVVRDAWRHSALVLLSCPSLVFSVLSQEHFLYFVVQYCYDFCLFNHIFNALFNKIPFLLNECNVFFYLPEDVSY